MGKEQRGSSLAAKTYMRNFALLVSHLTCACGPMNSKRSTAMVKVIVMIIIIFTIIKYAIYTESIQLTVLVSLYYDDMNAVECHLVMKSE